jgi:hypothetical protein
MSHFVKSVEKSTYSHGHMLQLSFSICHQSLLPETGGSSKIRRVFKSPVVIEPIQIFFNFSGHVLHLQSIFHHVPHVSPQSIIQMFFNFSGHVSHLQIPRLSQSITQMFFNFSGHLSHLQLTFDQSSQSVTQIFFNFSGHVSHLQIHRLVQSVTQISFKSSGQL